jgi:flagellar hook-associated protein 1 FlgK
MSLGNALQIGRSGLLASRVAVEAAGHNLANVSTAGYHRRTVNLAPLQSGDAPDTAFPGRGVQVQQIVRHVSAALETRLRTAISDQASAGVRQELLSQVEALENEFTDNDLSTHLGQFFNAWSDLAASPSDMGRRTLVVEGAATLAGFVRDLRANLTRLQEQVDQTAGDAVGQVNSLLEQIAAANIQIARLGPAGNAHDLLDQRDQMLADLSEQLDISVVTHENGTADVFAGSTALVLNGTAQPIALDRSNQAGQVTARLVRAGDGSTVEASGGRLATLVLARQEDIGGAIADLDSFAAQLIHQVNLVHSQGQGMTGSSSVTAEHAVRDTAAGLASEAAGLTFTPAHGSFRIHVTQASTGQRTSQNIQVNLQSEASTHTSLDDLAAQLDAVSGVDASIDAAGRLVIRGESGDLKLTFSDDTSGTLAALGINSFFAGTDAADIAVQSAVRQQPSLLAVAREHVAGDNRNALAIAGLRDQRLAALDDRSLTEQWGRHVEELAAGQAHADSSFRAAEVVHSSLQAQQQSVSGVNVDEEAINLLAFQRAYQGSARFLSVVDELYQTLLNLV